MKQKVKQKVLLSKVYTANIENDGVEGVDETRPLYVCSYESCSFVLSAPLDAGYDYSKVPSQLKKIHNDHVAADHGTLSSQQTSDINLVFERRNTGLTKQSLKRKKKVAVEERIGQKSIVGHVTALVSLWNEQVVVFLF